MMFASFSVFLVSRSALSQRSSAPVNAGRGGVAVRDTTSSPSDRGGRQGGAAEFEIPLERRSVRFRSAANRDQFAEEPQVRPAVWRVLRVGRQPRLHGGHRPGSIEMVDGRLYLNYSKRVQRMWEKDIGGNIVKGVANWPSGLNK